MMETGRDNRAEGDIFISYSHRDIEIVKHVAEVIKGSCNHVVWCDDSLRGGDNYFGVIADQIVLSKYFLFVVSGNSVTSKWCLRELEYAVSKEKIIVPIWLDDIAIPPRVELSIQNTHYIYYYQISQEEFLVEIKKVFSNGCPDKKSSASSRVDELISAANLGDCSSGDADDIDNAETATLCAEGEQSLDDNPSKGTFVALSKKEVRLLLRAMKRAKGYKGVQSTPKSHKKDETV